MKIQLWLLFYFFFSVGSLECALRWSRYYDLKLLQRYWIEGFQGEEKLGLSGLTTDGNSLFTVSDVEGISRIFQIHLKADSTASLSSFSNLDGKWLEAYEKRHSGLGRVDLEGIAYCAETFFLVDERKRKVLAYQEGKISQIDLPFSSFHAAKNRMNPFSGVINAGLEAITCDPNRNLLYVFNERMFRMGYIYSLDSSQILHQFDVPSGFRAPRMEQEHWVYPDFAGSDFHQGKLYLLVRNDYAVLELDGESLEVLRRFSFERHARESYQVPEIFGMAEGLSIFNGRLYLVFDNNEFERVDMPGAYNPMLLEFEIPQIKKEN